MKKKQLTDTDTEELDGFLQYEFYHDVYEELTNKDDDNFELFEPLEFCRVFSQTVEIIEQNKAKSANRGKWKIKGFLIKNSTFWVFLINCWNYRQNLLAVPFYWDILFHLKPLSLMFASLPEFDLNSFFDSQLVFSERHIADVIIGFYWPMFSHRRAQFRQLCPFIW